MNNEKTDEPPETDNKSPGEVVSSEEENPSEPTTTLDTSSEKPEEKKSGEPEKSKLDEKEPLDKKEKSEEPEESKPDKVNKEEKSEELEKPEKNEADKTPSEPPLSESSLNENGTEPQPEKKTQKLGENDSSSLNDDNQKEDKSQPKTRAQNFEEDDSSPQNNDDERANKPVIFEQEQKNRSWDDNFTDPTDTLRVEGHQLPQLADKEVEECYKKLQEPRLIVLTCLDEEVAISAAYSIVSLPKFSSLEKRILRTDVLKNKDRDDLSIDLLMEDYQFGKNPKGKDTIIVTMPSDDDNTNFYGSLISGSLGKLEVKDRCCDLNRFVVCIVNSTRLRERLRSEHNDIAFKFIEIDYLDPLIKHHTRDDQDDQKAEELLKELRKQKKDGLWKGENEAFYAQIKMLIAQNALIEEITRRSQASDQGYTQYLETEIEKIKGAFRQEKTIECAVLYVATFFEQLNTTDFSKVVECLLDGKTQPTDWEFTEGEETNTKLVDIWKKQRNKILNNYYITVVTLKDSTRVLDFSFPYLRRILRRYLEDKQPYYLEEQFERLQQYGLLFDESPKISQSVINLAVDMAVSNPEAYGGQWLSEWVVALMGKIDGDRENEALEEILRDFIRQMKHERKQHVFSRMANLTKVMMQHSHLHQTVNNFFNWLIHLGFHSEILEIVRRMRFVPNFEQLHWVKQLLERGNEDCRHQASRFLYNHIKYSRSRFNEVIEQLYDWMPQPDKNPKSGFYMFPLFIQFLVDSTVEFHQSQYGQPEKHLILSALMENIGRENENHAFTKLLFHPKSLDIIFESDMDPIELLLSKWNLTLRGGNYAVVTNVEQLFLHLASSVASSLGEEFKHRNLTTQRDLEQLLADVNRQHVNIIKREVADIIGVLIAEWFVIIHGLDDAQKNEEGANFFDQFLKQILSVEPARKKERAKELTECWKSMATLIRGVINNIKAQQQQERNKDRAQLIKSLALKEKRIKSLRNRLLALSKAG